MKEISKKINVFYKLLGIMGLIVPVIISLYAFFSYIGEMQKFYYWGINSAFYLQSNIVNDFLKGIFYFCIYLFLFYIVYSADWKNMKKLSICVFHIICLGFLFILSLKMLYEENFSKNSIISTLSACFIFYGLIHFNVYIFKKDLKNFKNDIEFYKKPINVILIIIITFVVISSIRITFSFVSESSKKNFQIINPKSDCRVILYSTKDYYIIAKCKIDDSILRIDNNTQMLIDSKNIEYRNMKFKKFEKINLNA